MQLLLQYFLSILICVQDNRGIKAHDAPKLRRQSKRIRDGGAAISDSLFEQIQGAAPHDARLTPVENAKALAYAATDALAARRQRLPRKQNTDTSTWTRVHPEVVFRFRGPAWSLVNVKPADRLPFMDVDGMHQFRVNQFCEDCNEWELCSTHAALASNDNVDFIPKHVQAMKAAGYCMVECGGAGDCFYHSMLFLASIYNQELYRAWHDHDTLRKKTCDNLLVTCHITMLCSLMFLSILRMYPGTQQFASSVSR